MDLKYSYTHQAAASRKGRYRAAEPRDTPKEREQERVVAHVAQNRPAHGPDGVALEEHQPVVGKRSGDAAENEPEEEAKPKVGARETA